jgi:hypothetical protein
MFRASRFEDLPQSTRNSTVANRSATAFKAGEETMIYGKSKAMLGIYKEITLELCANVELRGE